MGTPKPGILLLDLSGYIFRAFFALPPLTTKSGEPTQVIYGVTQMLLKLRDMYPSTSILSVGDHPAPTFRETLFPSYKEHRPPAPEELKKQIPPLKELVKKMGIPHIEKEGYEADDLLSVLAHTYKEKTVVYIVTGDKDLLQLVGERVYAYDPLKEELYDKSKVERKWGFPPERIPELLALMGDPVDGIPGVPGIGEKRAREILSRGSLPYLLEHPEEVPEKYREKWIRHKEQIALGYTLATLPRTIEGFLPPPIPPPPSPNWEELREFFQRWEFFSLLKRIPKTDDQTLTEKIQVETLSTEDFIELLSSPFLFIDLETTSLDPLSGEIISIGMARENGNPFYYKFPELREEQFRVLKALKEWLEDPHRKKGGHNLKFEYQIFLHYGIEMKGIEEDSMLLSYLLDPDSPSGHSLKHLSERYLGIPMKTYGEVTGGKELLRLPEESQKKYVGGDVVATRSLIQFLKPKVKEENLQEVYSKVEIPLIPVIAEMEYRGILVEKETLLLLKENFQKEMKETEEEIYHLAGHPFNLQSPRQVEKVLYDELKLQPLGFKKTKTGIRSTEGEVLEAMKEQHPVVEKILRYRTFYKLIHTYLDALLSAIHSKTRRIHPQFHQAVTATGRLSSSNPNLQNIPAKEEWGRKIRSAFIPEKGMVFLGLDYSQLDLRVLAHLSEDPDLVRFFQEGKDLHTQTAMELFHKKAEEVTPEIRRMAKTINFGLIYGMGEKRLAQELKITQKEAEEILTRYFSRFPGVKEYQEKVIRSAEELGYVTTLSGRKRWIPGIRSGDTRIRSQGIRMAINTPVQGSSADLMKMGMISVFQYLKTKSRKSALLLQVHDAILLEVPEEEGETLLNEIRTILEEVYPLKVPLVVDGKLGYTWKDVHT
jgi:DNA polymerase-1